MYLRYTICQQQKNQNCFWCCSSLSHYCSSRKKSLSGWLHYITEFYLVLFPQFLPPSTPWSDSPQKYNVCLFKMVPWDVSLELLDVTSYPAELILVVMSLSLCGPSEGGSWSLSRQSHLEKSLGLVCQPFALQLIYCSHSVTGWEAFFSWRCFFPSWGETAAWAHP